MRRIINLLFKSFIVLTVIVSFKTFFISGLDAPAGFIEKFWGFSGCTLVGLMGYDVARM